MMGRRMAKLRSGDEYDALTMARRFYRWRAGHRTALKRTFNKRERLVAKQRCEREAECLTCSGR